jgi:cation:H+ antiporter
MKRPVRAADRRGGVGAWVLLLALSAVGSISIVAVNLAHLRAGWAAALSFSGVLAASLLLSWGAEAAQFQVSRGLAVAGVAFLQVLPELTVEATIAWKQDVPLMFANATGSNRLLIGVGWALIFFTADASNRLRGRGGIRHVALEPSNVLEILALAAASSYYVVIIAKRSLALYDGLVLGALFAGYIAVLARLPSRAEEEKDDLLAPPRALVEIRSARVRWATLLALFLLGAGVMGFVAEPFVESMKALAVGLGVSTFAFVQWIAPLLSEFPEKVTAFYWSRTVRLAPMALLNMIASTVIQYSLLVATIPALYALSRGQAGAVVPMDPDHRAEMALSFAMTLYGCACLLKLRYTRTNAVTMFSLWVVQFVASGARARGGAWDVRWVESALLVTLALVEVIRHRREIHVLDGLRGVLASMRRP